MEPLKIALIASECVPFAKTGGLADVAGALPAALAALGHEVIVVVPKYQKVDAGKHGLRRHLHQLGVWMGDALEWCAVDVADGAAGVPVYFIENDRYFHRAGLYDDPASHREYADNPRRFGFFTRAALQLCRDMDFAPDIVHAHDWPTALAPAYLKLWHWDDPVLGKAASVLTIHNIAYQGVYGAESYGYLGLQARNFTPDKFEDHGRVNFLKGGIHFADMVNTVSPTYARETRTPAFAYGMAPQLNDKGANYVGILNGVDYADWNPAVDALIPARFAPEDLSGKAVCKAELQKTFLLEADPDIPVVGVVSRLEKEQKGLDLLAAAVESIARNMRVQFAILGSGDKGLEGVYRNLPARYPGRVGSYIGFDNKLAHLIEAGSDFFVMPSRYEPCGLNQMYSLKYGTLPIVRATGGLNDTVEQYDERTGAGTGFKFDEPSARAIYYTVGWAVSSYYDRRPHIRQMIQNAMAQDFGWEASAREYERLYERAIANKQAL